MIRRICEHNKTHDYSPLGHSIPLAAKGLKHDTNFCSYISTTVTLLPVSIGDMMINVWLQHDKFKAKLELQAGFPLAIIFA